jgi:hypothetical protein
MADRPKWVREIHAFVTDTIIDEQFKFPMDGSDDELHDRIKDALNAVLCAEYGHEIIDDQCGIPSHAGCAWCHRGVIDINHMTHARHCNCLDDSAECCVESCPCPRVSHTSTNPQVGAAPENVESLNRQRRRVMVTIVDSSSDEGMLREAHDLLRMATFSRMPARWLADDLVQRIAARFPEPADVVDPQTNADQRQGSEGS